MWSLIGLPLSGFLACHSRRESDVQRRCSLQYWQSCKLRDEGFVPLICPTCQNVFSGKASMPATPFAFKGFLTVHGVVFDVLLAEERTFARWAAVRQPSTRLASEGWLRARPRSLHLKKCTSPMLKPSSSNSDSVTAAVTLPPTVESTRTSTPRPRAAIDNTVRMAAVFVTGATATSGTS